MSAYALAIALFSCNATAAERSCIDRAAARFDVSARVLAAIVQQESSGQCMARHPINRDGTYDISCTGINSSWIPHLTQRFGITERSLNHPCTNIHVGAWILAHNIRQHGDTWRAIGAYNAATESKRRAYAWKIVARMQHSAR